MSSLIRKIPGKNTRLLNPSICIFSHHCLHFSSANL